MVARRLCHNDPMSDAPSGAASAVEDFWRLRRRARLREVLDQLSGGSSELLPYDDVRRRMRAVESTAPRLEDVPLAAIVGSVGRYRDFTREFLPRQNSDKERWVRVKLGMTGDTGLPPIEVYRIGDAYFVKDGNHRVSVMRELGAEYIQAYVTPVHTRVTLHPDDDPDDIILKAEYARFLEETRLDELRPGADLTVTAPGQYDTLLEHISVHRYYLGIDEDREVPYEEAVGHWYDHVYRPVVEAILATGLLRGFEGRTETDLYLWLSEHRGRLEEEMGWKLPSETIAENLQAGPRLSPEQRDELLDKLAHDREEVARVRLADDVLVALTGRGGGFAALEQALEVARFEQATLYGLHVVATQAEAQAPAAAAVRARFEGRCREAGVAHQFTLAVGGVVELLLERASWVDLVVADLTDPAANARFGAQYRAMLRRCPKPLLAVPRSADSSRARRLERVLLAYDASQRAEEALFAAAYVTAKWKLPLVVVTVSELGRPSAVTLDRARRYLGRFEIEADFLQAGGPVAETIVETAEAHRCDVIFMGSHAYSRWLESMLGGVLEEVLQRAERPVLIT